MDYDRVILEMLNRISILEEKVLNLERNGGYTAVIEQNEISGVSKKYRFLADYLHNSNLDAISMTFDEIEKIIGFKLPNSALIHRAFWANTTTHSIALSWINVGYETVDVDLTNKSVTFEKKRGY